MGNMFTAPQKTGKNPWTLSGQSPVKLVKTSDKPGHRHSEPMSLELHMADDRVRTAGLTPAEREWRQKWLKDQNLHPDEPVHVDAVHRQLNPVRMIYRKPWDYLYKRFLNPTFGPYYGLAIRVLVPKVIFTVLVIQVMYYQWKYNAKDWTRLKGISTITRHSFVNSDEIKKDYPGLLEKAIVNEAKYDWLDPNYHQRAAPLNIGETARKY